MITVFTPAYNRAYIIGQLYDSLCRQTCKAFEWLIVDDGSTDNTKGLITSFISENKIRIRYIDQCNGGKHTAINRGVREAKGELFFIVDSDDSLAEDAIEKFQRHFSEIKNDQSFCGVSGLRVNFSKERIGDDLPQNIVDCSPLDLRFKYHINGDMAEAFKTDILKHYPFPVYDGEMFCPEALIWNRLSLKYKMRYTREKIYFCEYRPDGLTAQITRLRMYSPKASMLYYSELYRMPIPFVQKIKAAINFWRFSFCSNIPFKLKISKIGWGAIIAYPVGLLFYLSDLRK